MPLLIAAAVAVVVVAVLAFALLQGLAGPAAGSNPNYALAQGTRLGPADAKVQFEDYSDFQ